jgi:glycosyltransferase involved in cell wall biosynthesis
MRQAKVGPRLTPDIRQLRWSPSIALPHGGIDLRVSRSCEGGAESPAFSVAVASCSYDSDLIDPDALLDRYHAMTGWAEALNQAGAGTVTVVQRFTRNASIRRGSVDYRFVADNGPGLVAPWFWGSHLTHVVRDLRPNAVHVDGLVFPALVRRLRLGLPRHAAIVVQDHGGVRLPAVSLASPARRLLYGFGLRAADAFMFTTREQATPWQNAGIIRDRQAVHEVLESSTNLGSMPFTAHGVKGLPGSPAILWVGRLDQNKDPLTVLGGFAQIADLLPQAELTLVYGDDLLLPAVEGWLATRSDLTSRIHLRGRVDRTALPVLYNSADLFVLGSHREVACFSLIEALSFGVTPVVTDIPPFRAITGAGTVGALFTPGDTGAMARALMRANAADLGSRRATVRAHFDRELSWAAVGRRALAVYRSASEKRWGLPACRNDSPH